MTGGGGLLLAISQPRRRSLYNTADRPCHRQARDLSAFYSPHSTRAYHALSSGIVELAITQNVTGMFFFFLLT